jgi:hypothetical protein
MNVNGKKSFGLRKTFAQAKFTDRQIIDMLRCLVKGSDGNG